MALFHAQLPQVFPEEDSIFDFVSETFFKCLKLKSWSIAVANTKLPTKGSPKKPLQDDKEGTYLSKSGADLAILFFWGGG